jgi:predicted transcriptional regulator YdeE
LSQQILVSDITRLDGFTLIGKSARTTNVAEMKGEGIIPSHWERFFQEGTLNHIPFKKDEKIHAVYTEYESDETGPYSFVIGAAVTQVDEVPQGMTSYAFEESAYVVFTTRKGPLPEIVVEAWQFIWEWSKTHKRAFQADFEVYDERCSDPQNSQVDIYISVASN